MFVASAWARAKAIETTRTALAPRRDVVGVPASGGREWRRGGVWAAGGRGAAEEGDGKARRRARWCAEDRGKRLIEGDVRCERMGAGEGDRDDEDRVGAEAGFVGGAVELEE